MARGRHNTSDALILAALPATAGQLNASLPLHPGTISKRLTALHREGRIHIGAWLRVREGEKGAHWVRLYAAGPGVDAPCTFKKKTRAQINAAFIARARASGRLDAIAAKKRARWWIEKARRQRDPLVAALFGEKEEQ